MAKKKIQKKARVDVYERVTEQIISALEKGVPPWRNPILATPAGTPKSLASDKPYRGVNTFLLGMASWAEGYTSPYWLTYKEAERRGGHVRKGEHGQQIIFFKELMVDDKNSGQADAKKRIPMIRFFTVFNARQCEGVSVPEPAVRDPSEPFHELDIGQRILQGFPSPGPVMTECSGRAFYRPATDTVALPSGAGFDSSSAYYATAFHELVHATGHSTRLDRDCIVAKETGGGGVFGDADYSREELVAELGAAFLCAEAGILPKTLEQSAAYCQSWIKVLKGEKKLIVQAGSAAQKAADFILERQPHDAVAAA